MKLRIEVKPNAKTSRLEQQADGSWRAWLKAPPVDGKANAELIALVAQRFGVTKRQVEIRAGAGGRSKSVRLLP